ncbi:MAG: biotin/lipoyl-binding protein [bacterium]|nr:biotin/lipoyl-binding protein [bacterium]
MQTAGRLLSIGIVAAAVLLGIVVLTRVVRHPKTDDATVMADVVNVVPEVSGRIVELHVADNQAVQQGDLLFVIDPRPYALAVERARAEVQALDAQIALTKRHIEGQEYATAAARAAVQRAEAQARSAADTYHRLRPLAREQYVTAERLDEAQAAMRSTEATLDEARRRMMQAEKDVGDLDALIAQRDAAAAALGKAELDLGHTRVEAPFDALVVNLYTAVGAFVGPGPIPVFALVDRRRWYVVANYRESELDRIAPGMDARVYLMSDPRRSYRGTVQGIGWAVNPEDQRITPGIPSIRRELNWVHIAQRFPVRIAIEDPRPAEVFRVGASAVAIVLGHPDDQGRPAGR